MTRQLTAIMFVDMVGFTALMQEDERGAKLLRDRQRAVLEERVAGFEGEILQYYGDGALCGFQSAIQAVECAIAIQVDLREEPPVPVRIGLHLGDVVREKSGVYGDGVNIAARIQSLSVSGGVLVSGKIAAELRNQPTISAEMMARVKLKNVNEPQTVFAVTNAGLATPTPRDMKEWPRVYGKGGRSRWGLRGLGWGAAVVAIGVVLTLFLSKLRESEAPPATPLTQESLAILPFHHEGAAELDPLGRVLAIQLSSVLASGVFLPIDQPSIRSLVEGLEGEGLSGPPLWERVATTVGSDLVLYGDIVSDLDGALMVNAYFFDPRTSETGAPVSERGTVDGFNPLVLSLARKLLLARSGADPGLLGDLESSSIEAMFSWEEGEREFRAGNYPRAVELLKDAVEADPGLAIAHYRLSQAAVWDWEWDLARSAAEDAWELSSELSGKNQNLLGAWRNFLNSRPREAESQYRHLLRDNPQNVEVMAGLVSVLVYFNSLQGRPTRAAEPFIQRVLEADPDYGEVRYHALESAARDDDEAEFERWFAGLNPESQQALAFRAVRAFRWGSSVDREEVVHELQDADEFQAVYAAGRLAAFLHDFSGAERVGRLLLGPGKDPDFRAAAPALSACLAFAQGKWRDADRELTSAADLEGEWSLEMRTLFSLFLSTLPFTPVSRDELRLLKDSIQIWEPEASVLPSFSQLFGPHAQHHQELRLYLLGLLSATLGEAEAAREYSDRLREYGRGPETLALTYALAQSVDAHRLRSEGNAGAARVALESIGYFPRFEFIFVSPFFSRALDRWLRGELLRELERPEEALQWYNTLSDGWGEFLFAGPAHLRQAQIHEGLGNVDQAVLHYDRFVTLWGDADPAFQPLVDRAREARDALMVGDGGSSENLLGSN